MRCNCEFLSGLTGRGGRNAAHAALVELFSLVPTPNCRARRMWSCERRLAKNKHTLICELSLWWREAGGVNIFVLCLLRPPWFHGERIVNVIGYFRNAFITLMVIIRQTDNLLLLHCTIHTLLAPLGFKSFLSLIFQASNELWPVSCFHVFVHFLKTYGKLWL